LLAQQEAARVAAERASAQHEADAAETLLRAELAAHRLAEHQAAEEATARSAEADTRAAVEAAYREGERLAAEQAAHEAAEHAAAMAAEQAAHRAAEVAARQAAEQAAAEHAAVEAVREAAARAPATPSALRGRAPEDTLVMVADDSKVVRVKTSRLLAQHRYRVVLAEDGAQAAQLIEQEVPLVLITDVEMPGMDGFELTRFVRQHPRARHIPIIMITSADDRLKAAAAEAGVTLVLGKPYAEDALLACIEQAMAGEGATA
jgi:CheY-like chemotaxis protein